MTGRIFVKINGVPYLPPAKEWGSAALDEKGLGDQGADTGNYQAEHPFEKNEYSSAIIVAISALRGGMVCIGNNTGR